MWSQSLAQLSRVLEEESRNGFKLSPVGVRTHARESAQPATHGPQLSTFSASSSLFPQLLMPTAAPVLAQSTESAEDVPPLLIPPPAVGALTPLMPTDTPSILGSSFSGNVTDTTLRIRREKEEREHTESASTSSNASTSSTNLSTNSTNYSSISSSPTSPFAHPLSRSAALPNGVFNKLSDAACTQIAHNCTHLHTLDLAFCASVSDSAVIALAQHLHLHALTLAGCLRITDKVCY